MKNEVTVVCSEESENSRRVYAKLDDLIEFISENDHNEGKKTAYHLVRRVPNEIGAVEGLDPITRDRLWIADASMNWQPSPRHAVLVVTDTDEDYDRILHDAEMIRSVDR